MEFFKGTLYSLLHNYVLICAGLAWFLAQVLKTLLYFILNGKMRWERMVGSGGMPSAHTACVSALTIATCRYAGFSSVEFAISFILAIIVIYDALNVRRQAGEHAKAINIMVDRLDNESDDEDDLGIKELKESLGHKPMEVLAGALLGILTAMLIPVLQS